MSEALANIYFKTVLPVEQMFMFHAFHAPPLGPADFFAKPTGAISRAHV